MSKIGSTMEAGKNWKQHVELTSGKVSSINKSLAPFDEATLEDDEPSLGALTADECSSSSCSLAGRTPVDTGALPSSPLFLIALDRARRSTSMADEDLDVMGTSFDEGSVNVGVYIPPPPPPEIQRSFVSVPDEDEEKQEETDRSVWNESDAEAVGTLTSSLARITEGMSELVCAGNEEDGEKNRQRKMSSMSALQQSQHSQGSVSGKNDCIQDGLCVFCSNCGCLGPCSCIKDEWDASDGNDDELLVEGTSSLENSTEIEQMRVDLEKDVTWLLGCASDSDMAEACLMALRSLLFLSDNEDGDFVNCCGGCDSTSGSVTTDTARSTPDGKRLECNSGIKQVLIRNRSVVLRAQAARIRRLRSDMYFAAARQENNRASQGFLFPGVDLSRSVDDQDVMNLNPLSPSRSLARYGHGPQQKDDSSVISLDKASAAPSPSALFYDSDPGEMLSATSSSRKSVPRRASSFRSMSTIHRRTKSFATMKNRADFYRQTPSFALTSVDSDDDSFTEDSTGMQEQSTPPTSNKQFFFDDEYVSQFIKEMTNGNATLVYHPSSTQTTSSATTTQSKPNQNSNQHEKHRSSTTPVCVQAWFEMGSRLQSKLIQPKFMWRVAYQPDLHNKKKLHHSCVNPDSLELLNIIRVIQPTRIDRSIHPFAKLNHSFVIIANDQQARLFEASSQKERDRFVTGLKLVIARLASKIIVGNEDVFDEFFTPWGTALDDFYGDDGDTTEDGYDNQSKSMDEDDVDCAIKENEPMNPLVATAAKESKNAKQLWGLPWR